MEPNEFCITTLCCNDRKTLFAVLTAFSIRTKIPDGTVWTLLLQGCADSFVEKVKELSEKIKVNQNYCLRFEFLVYKENMGLSRGMNTLAEKTKHFKYILHVEDDWLCLPHKITSVDWNWLFLCLRFLRSRPEVSTIYLRKYVDAAEKQKFAWTKHAFYNCHTHKDNFNYADKMKFKPKIKYAIEDQIEKGNNVTASFQEIPTFLFTFNPCIRRNEDYFKAGAYPLQEFADAVAKREQWTLTQYDEAPQWGWCEAFAMEKIRDLICYNFEAGVFGHYEDWIARLEKEGYSY